MLCWITHVTNCIGSDQNPQAFSVAIIYIECTAHEWRIGFKGTEDGQRISTWPSLKEAFVRRFESLNRVKIARDKLAKWRQIKDMASFNEDFGKKLLEIPSITIEYQIDSYARGLKPLIWMELCKREYNSLTDLMRDTERVESAFRRSGKVPVKNITGDKLRASRLNCRGPMDIGNFTLKKMSPAEREMCRKEGRSFRCHEKGHMANKCQKARGN